MGDPSRLTFLGHSTVLIEIGGKRILTDPVLFDRLTILRRVTTSLDPRLYQAIDIVLLSHLHLDHFDVPSLRLLGRDVLIVVPPRAGRLLRRLGFSNVAEAAPSVSVHHEGVSIGATPAAHGGYRPPFGPRAGAVGYVVEADGIRIYFAGDTELFDGMANIGPELDLALLPVWGWGPTLGTGHLNPATAAEALRLLGARAAVPIHWGTLWPLGLGRVRAHRLADPPVEFATLAAQLCREATVVVLTPGESVVLDRRGVVTMPGT